MWQHVLIKHSTWFVNEYGSLALWSTQGMEKSHYQCKTSFSKHTQHGGGVNGHSAIIQAFEWWYRLIQHREEEKETIRLQEPARQAAAALKETR